MNRKFYKIEKDNNDIVKLYFVENNKVGTYTQDLNENGIDIKRVMRPIDENTEKSLVNKASFEDGEPRKNIQCMTDSEFIRKMEWLLK